MLSHPRDSLLRVARIAIGLFIWILWSGLLAQSINGPVDALERVLKDSTIRKRLEGQDALRSETRFLERWKVWMVQFYAGDESLAFASVDASGAILERGPADTARAADEDRRTQLQAALERARDAGNEAEVREILELLERRTSPSKSLNQLLEEIRGFASYGQNVMRWSPDESSRNLRLRIDRSSEDGWERIAEVPWSKGIWRDPEVVVGATYHYRVSFVMQEQESLHTFFQLTPRAMQGSPLPHYEIRLEEGGLEQILADVREDVEVKGTFCLDETCWPIELRLRGASTRHALKKSYRIQFNDGSPFDRDVIYLKAEPMDHTLQQEKLSCDVFLAEGAWCSTASYVNLTLNGQYEGVYLDIEPVRAPFRTQHMLDPQGILIRAQTFGAYDAEPLGDLRGKGDGLLRLKTFLKDALTVSNAAFGEWIHAHMDWPRVRDYLILQVLSHRSEIESNDYFFYQDPGTGKWSFIPWDHNNGNFAVAAYENRVLEPRIGLFPQTIQDIGWTADYAYLIHSRIFQDPLLCRDYLLHLKERVQSWLLEGRLDVLIDSNFDRLRQDFVLDPYRTPFSGTDPFLRSADDLKQFSHEHGIRLVEMVDDALNRRSELTLHRVESPDGRMSVRIQSFGDRAIPLETLRLVLRIGPEIREVALPRKEPLEPGHFVDIGLNFEINQLAWAYLLSNMESAHARERVLPIAFCTIPSIRN